MAADLGGDCAHRLEVAHLDAEGRADCHTSLRSADQQKSPGLCTILHFCFDAVEKKLSEGLEGGITDLADVFHPQAVRQGIDSKVAEHLALVREKAGIAALARLERENVVANEALHPFHAIVAGNANLAAVREVRESDCLAYRVVLRDPLAIVSGHFPPCDVFEDGAEFLVVLVEAGLFHCSFIAWKRSAVSDQLLGFADC